MSISRQVGTLQELYPVFIQDATVSTGLGLPNLTISTFSSYYYRSDMTSTSSVTLVSTGTLGTWSSGQFLQINSTFMRGWYQFCLPNGIFAAGSSCALHLYGHPSMAPNPILFEITRFNNQGWVSSQPHNVTRAYSDVLVTSAAGVLTVDVSTILRSIPVTSFAGVLTANVSTIHGSRAVTTAAGILLAGPVGVSSVTDKEGYSVTSMNVGVNVTSVRGTTAVTTVAGYFPTHFDLELTRNVNSTVAFSSVSWSTQSVSVGSVDVTSFYGSGLVTTAAGRLAVGPVGVSSVTDKAGYGVSSFQASIDVSSIYGTAFITSAAGVPSVNVSTLLGSKVLTSFAGVQTVNVSTLHGSRWVTTAAGLIAVDPVGVSSVTDKVGYSVSSMNVGVNVTSVRGTTAVTTVAGYFPSYFDLELTRNVNSTVAFSSVSWSTQSVSVGSVDVTSVFGTRLVTSAAGFIAVERVGVSSFNTPVGVSAFALRVGVSSMNIGVSVTTMGTGVGVTTMGIGVGVTTLSVPVDVTSFYGSALITSAAGVLASHVTSMRIAVDAQIVDRILGRNIASGSDGTRTVTEALRLLRNRSDIAASTLTVYEEDDATPSWSANVTTTAGNPISQVDPT